MKMLVCGGRTYSNNRRMAEVLDELARRFLISKVVHGAARGADTLAGLWARANKIEEKAYPADWRKHGLSAGPIRNEAMLQQEHPDIIVAFPGGPGTRDMLRRTVKSEAKVYVIDPSEFSVQLSAELLETVDLSFSRAEYPTAFQKDPSP